MMLSGTIAPFYNANKYRAIYQLEVLWYSIVMYHVCSEGVVFKHACAFGGV